MNQSTIKKRYIAPAMLEYRLWENSTDVLTSSGERAMPWDDGWNSDFITKNTGETVWIKEETL